MKNFLQLIVLTTIIIVSLTACSEQQRSDIMRKIKEKQFENGIKKLPTHNEPMPEYPQIEFPSELSREEINKNIWYVNRQVVQNVNRTIYFSKNKHEDGERDLVQNREDSEYYRNIYGVTVNGDCAVQDFYSENDQKQMELVIIKKNECESWKSKPFDGMAVWYDKDGKINKEQGIAWLNKGELERYIEENKQTQEIIYSKRNIRPNIHKTISVSIENIPNIKRSAAIECEYNEKENKIEKVILFHADNMVTQVRFVDNKLDPSQSILWTAQGKGHISSIKQEMVEPIQNLAWRICGVKNEQSAENKIE